jgi:hypothetical protein
LSAFFDFYLLLCISISQTGGGGDESAPGSRRSSILDDRRPSLRRVDQENLLKVRRDSKTRRPSLADVIPDWPALHKVKRPEKVNNIRIMESYIYKYLNYCFGMVTDRYIYSSSIVMHECVCLDLIMHEHEYLELIKETTRSIYFNIYINRKKKDLLNHYKTLNVKKKI